MRRLAVGATEVAVTAAPVAAAFPAPGSAAPAFAASASAADEPQTDQLWINASSRQSLPVTGVPEDCIPRTLSGGYHPHRMGPRATAADCRSGCWRTRSGRSPSRSVSTR